MAVTPVPETMHVLGGKGARKELAQWQAYGGAQGTGAECDYLVHRRGLRHSWQKPLCIEGGGYRPRLCDNNCISCPIFQSRIAAIANG